MDKLSLFDQYNNLSDSISSRSTSTLSLVVLLICSVIAFFIYATKSDNFKGPQGSVGEDGPQGPIGVQLKSDNSFRIGANPTHRKEIVKIDCKTKQIVEEYKSVTIASEKLNLETDYIRTCIKDKRIIENFMLEYKKNIDILEDV